MSKLTLQAQLDSLAGLDQPDGFEIGTLTRYDIPDLAHLYLDSYIGDEQTESFENAVEQLRMAFDGAFGEPVDNCFVGAWQDTQLVGAIFTIMDSPWEDTPPGPFVVDMFVHPSFRSCGIATALIGEVATRCANAGEDALSLRVDLHRAHEAAKLYEYLGFAEV